MPSSSEKTLDLYTLVTFLWQRKRIIIAGLAVSLAGAVFHLATTPRSYTATSTIAPADTLEPGEQPLLGRSAAATLFGEKSDSTDFAIFREFVRSVELARRLQVERQVLQRLLAARWDAETQTWDMSPQGAIQMLAHLVAQMLGRDPQRDPDEFTLAATLERMLVLREKAGADVWQLQVTTNDPRFSADLVQWVYQVAVDLTRAHQLHKVEQLIAFIEPRTSEIQNTEQRLALLEMLAYAVRKRTLLASNLPAGAEVIVPPEVSPYHTAPRVGRTLVVAFGMGLALGLAAIATIAFADYLRRESRARRADG